MWTFSHRWRGWLGIVFGICILCCLAASENFPPGASWQTWVNSTYYLGAIHDVRPSALRGRGPKIGLFCRQTLLTKNADEEGGSGPNLRKILQTYFLDNPLRKSNNKLFCHRDITRYLIKLLLLRGYAFNHTADFETVRMMKEMLCYVGYDIMTEQKLAQETTFLVEPYTLPDGHVIKVQINYSCIFH